MTPKNIGNSAKNISDFFRSGTIANFAAIKEQASISKFLHTYQTRKNKQNTDKN